MEIIEKEIEGLIEIIPDVFHDDRGWFLESYNRDKFLVKGLKLNFVQDNLSFSKAGVIRGLHFQKNPFSQGKLVKVIKGEVLDVALDLRAESKTFGQHVKVLLTADKQNMFYLPEGFAHGFVAKVDSFLFYKCTVTYQKEHDTGVAFNDPDLGIDWEVNNFITSEKDKNLQSFAVYKSTLGL